MGMCVPVRLQDVEPQGSSAASAAELRQLAPQLQHAIGIKAEPPDRVQPESMVRADPNSHQHQKTVWEVAFPHFGVCDKFRMPVTMPAIPSADAVVTVSIRSLSCLPHYTLCNGTVPLLQRSLRDT